METWEWRPRNGVRMLLENDMTMVQYRLIHKTSILLVMYLSMDTPTDGDRGRDWLHVGLLQEEITYTVTQFLEEKGKYG